MFVHQSISHPAGVSVFGSALLRAEPDLAQVELSIVRICDKPVKAFEQTRQALRVVTDVLRGRGVPDKCIQTSQVSVEMAYGDYPQRKFLGYRAGINLRILLENLSVIESLLSEVVEAGAHHIEGVAYQTSHLKKLRAQAREYAVASARGKAEVYARAAGIGLGSVLHIEDVNPEEVRRRGHSPDLDLTDHDEMGDPGTLQSGSILITAAVMMTFAIIAQA